MDDTLEDEAPKAKARTGRASARKPAADGTKPRQRASATKAGAAERETVNASKSAAKRTRRSPKPKAAGDPAPVVPELTQSPRPDMLVPAPVAALAVGPEEVVPVADVALHPVEPHAPDVRPHDHGLEFGLSPVDLAPDARVREEAGLGWFVRILAISSVLLVLVNSFAIDKWSREQPVTPLNSRALVAAQQLHAEMKSYHLDAPLEAMRSLWHGIRDAGWPASSGKDARAAAQNRPAS